MSRKELKSGIEWLQEPEFVGLTITDPDGWDRENLQDSFAEEISLDDFRFRLARSTSLRLNRAPR